VRSIWDVENKRKQKTVIVVKSKERGTRTKVTACAYSGDGKVIAGGESGVIVFLGQRANEGAQGAWTVLCTFGTHHRISCARTRRLRAPTSRIRTRALWCFRSTAGRCSRGAGTTPSSVRLPCARCRWRSLNPILGAVWDVRAFKKPLAAHEGLTSLYPQTNAIFSPDEKYVLTGSGATAKGRRGKLVFLKRDTFEVVQEMEMESTVVKVVWHSKINQVREHDVRPYLQS
jgi:hypothetical protein